MSSRWLRPEVGISCRASASASFGPFVGLLGEDSADEPDDGVAVGEDPDCVGPAADLSVEPLRGLFDQICDHASFGNVVNARMSARAVSRWWWTAGSRWST